MRNVKAVFAVVVAIAALALLAAAAAVPRFRSDVEPLHALVVVPGAALLGLVAIALARRARFDFQRTLGRVGGDGIAAFGWFLGLASVLVSLSAALAVGVYAVLTYTQN